MTCTRRLFALRSLATLASTAVTVAPGTTRARTRGPLRLLILGGTQYVGIHLVREAQRRGHTVTLFNRGRTNPGLFPELEKLRGDRDGELDALRGRQWDAVIDDSGYVPRHVQLTTQLLAPAVQQYLYFSSMSAYASFRQPNNEDSPLAELHETGTEQISGATYGPFKALSETVVRAAFPGRNIILRPGFVVGPQDPHVAFSYWLAQSARGGRIPVPGTPDVPLQFIDVRDLARFALDLIEQPRSGTWNVVSSPGQVRMGAFMKAVQASAQRHGHPAQRPEPEWIPVDFIRRQGIVPVLAFPLWPGNPDEPALMQISARRAIAAGLRFSSLQTTVDDTFAWMLSQPDVQSRALTAGLNGEPQAGLLAAWQLAQQRG